MNPFKYVESYFFETTPNWIDRLWFYGFIFLVVTLSIYVKLSVGN